MGLSGVSEQVMLLVAMAADDHRVGCVDGPDAQKWLDALCDAVERGLDAAMLREWDVS